MVYFMYKHGEVVDNIVNNRNWTGKHGWERHPQVIKKDKNMALLHHKKCLKHFIEKRERAIYDLQASQDLIKISPMRIGIVTN